MNKKNKYIVCPNCGMEYLPCEIFIPNYFIGKCTNIKRDYSGKLVEYDGQNMQLTEKYVCDKCNKPFNISALVNFVTRPNKLEDFTEDYSTPLKNGVVLSED